jgi:energy-coupling factor transport system ATP-binding protein
MPIIELDRVSFRHDGSETDALRDVRLTIEEGEYVAILGRNGAGKTTLGQCLNGIVPNLVTGELRGRVSVAGHDPARTPVRAMAGLVGMVFDNPEFQMSQLTVAEEVAFGLENLGVPMDEMPPRIGEALAMVGLEGFEERVPLALSSGEQQRLAIASVLVMRPRILVLDEPTSNLDPVGKGTVFEIARRLNRQAGMTIVIAEHDVDAVARHADRVVALDRGTVVATGEPREVLGRRELLESIGVRLPQVTELALRLRDGRAGWSGAIPLTADEAAAAIERRLAGSVP